MTNRELSDVFTDIYNGFWMKHRDSLPEISDSDGWNAIVKEAGALVRKHDCQLARDMTADLLAVTDQRQRNKERETTGGK